MQFQVPQNIDMEDKIVGPLTLIQFLYLLGGGLVVYLLFQSLATDYFAIFLLLGIPIALIALALAFFKIQEQPLSHFIVAGFTYLTQPKVRLWRRQTNFQPILTAPIKEEKPVSVLPQKHLGKSELESLALNLDTQQPPKKEAKSFGQITAAFERLLREQPAKAQSTKLESTK